MIAIPIFYTLLSLIIVIGGMVYVFSSNPPRTQYTLQNWLSGIFMSTVGVVLWRILEGHWGPWSIAYLVIALISNGLDVYKVGKWQSHGPAYGIFVIALSSFWAWAVWHVYLSRGA